jgi:hypothetical protein
MRRCVVQAVTRQEKARKNKLGRAAAKAFTAYAHFCDQKLERQFGSFSVSSDIFVKTSLFCAFL